MNIYYEVHKHPEPEFPLIFRDIKSKRNENVSGIHWHEALELLQVKRGEIQVLSDASRIYAREGDTVVINSNAVHIVNTLSEETQYYCLIIDCGFINNGLFDPEDTVFCSKIDDEKIVSIYDGIVCEIEDKLQYYQENVKALISQMCVELWRKHRAEGDVENVQGSNKISAVKKVIKFLTSNCKDKISVDEVCEYAGYSKYHFSRIFKEYTGMSIIEFLNFERCSRAERMMAEGMSVSASAIACGFENMSYFTRTFKKYRGCMPSDKKKTPPM